VLLSSDRIVTVSELGSVHGLLDVNRRTHTHTNTRTPFESILFCVIGLAANMSTDILTVK
jgi:hypothetical protein